MSAGFDMSLLARHLSGECTESESELVKLWIASAPENERLAELMKTVWATPEAESPDCDTNALWADLAEKAGITVGSTGQGNDRDEASGAGRMKFSGLFHADNYRLLRYAALLAVLLTTGMLLKNFMPWSGGTDLVTIHVENAQRQTLTLNEGSVIILDAGSTLQYPKKFNTYSRDIILSGEAYFEVTADAERPFVVHTQHASIRVLGTKFNVRAWRPDKQIVVAVTEGEVAFGASYDTTQAVILTQGQASTLTSDGGPSAPFRFDPEEHLGWMQNEFAFSNTSLYSILFHLSRRYDVDFVLADSSIAAERLNLHVRNESLADILALLNVLTGLEYRKEGKSVILTPIGSKE